MLMKVPLITFETTIATLLNTSVKRLYEFEKDSIADYCKVIQETDEEGQLKMKSNVKQALKEYLQVSNSAEGAQQKWTLCKPMLNDFQEITPEDLAVILDQPQESDGEGEEEEEESESESENDAEKQQLAQALSQSAKDAEQQNEPEKKVLIVEEDQDQYKNSGVLVYKYWYRNQGSGESTEGKHDYKRVPIIIRLVNCVMHKVYAVDPKYSRAHNLLNVLTNIAELSPVIRKYFLTNMMVGKILDWFYGDLSKYWGNFNDLSNIPIFQTNIECFIPKIEPVSFLSDFDEDGGDSYQSSCFAEQYYTHFYKLISCLV